MKQDIRDVVNFNGAEYSKRYFKAFYAELKEFLSSEPNAQTSIVMPCVKTVTLVHDTLNTPNLIRNAKHHVYLHAAYYPKYADDIAHCIAYNFAYKSDKYTFYNNVKEELDKLSKKYKLLLLTDNWPSVERILKENKLYKYFDKIYISSQYGSIKSEGIFFDYLLNDYNIKKGDALFIDDSIENLDVGVEKGLDVLLMDREKNIECDKYKKISDLNDI